MTRDPKVNFEIVQGETLRFRFACISGGEPVDVPDCTFAAQIRQDLDSPPVATLTTANGRIEHDPATGWFTLKLTAAETKRLKLEDGEGVWDLFVKAVDADAYRLMHGDVTYTRAVTR
jgi:hypothetical protein